DIDALIDQGPDDDFCSAQRLGRHDSLLSGDTHLSHPPQALRGGGRTLVSPTYPVNTHSSTNPRAQRSRVSDNGSASLKPGVLWWRNHVIWRFAYRLVARCAASTASVSAVSPRRWRRSSGSPTAFIAGKPGSSPRASSAAASASAPVSIIRAKR